jgi:hypothetical protein
MNIDPKQRKEIEKIIGEIKCPKDFICYKSGFENLCKAKDIGLERHLDCLEKNPRNCIFAIPFGNRYICYCPLRVYMVKELKISGKYSGGAR